MKHLKRFNESGDNKLANFTKEFKELVTAMYNNDFTRMSDVVNDVGDLCDRHNITLDEIKQAIDNGDDNGDGILKKMLDKRSK